MTLDEAYEWLRGNRSHTNTMMDVEPSPEHRTETIANIEVADAATTQCAYWMVRAHKEGLIHG